MDTKEFVTLNSYWRHAGNHVAVLSDRPGDLDSFPEFASDRLSELQAQGKVVLQ